MTTIATSEGEKIDFKCPENRNQYKTHKKSVFNFPEKKITQNATMKSFFFKFSGAKIHRKSNNEIDFKFCEDVSRNV